MHKVLDAYAEREVQKVRWSAVLAGLFLAMGTQILFGLLGAAVGLTIMDARSPSPIASFGPGAGAWSALVALFSLFVGGYAAAKLSGSIHRGDGVLSGTLTWATSLIVALWLGFAGLSAAASSVQQSAPAPGAPVELHTRDVARGAWFAFGGASLSLIAAMVGGALGAVGKPGAKGTRRREREPVARL